MQSRSTNIINRLHFNGRYHIKQNFKTSLRAVQTGHVQRQQTFRAFTDRQTHRHTHTHTQTHTARRSEFESSDKPAPLPSLIFTAALYPLFKSAPQFLPYFSSKFLLLPFIFALLPTSKSGSRINVWNRKWTTLVPKDVAGKQQLRCS